MVIDVGTGAKAIPTKCVRIAKEEYYGTVIDAYMLTHYHSAHIGALDRILKNTKIKKLYLPTPKTESETIFCELIKEVAKDCKIVTYDRGETVTFEKVEIESTPYSLLERSTHPVIALNFSFSGKSVTFVTPSISESKVNFEAESFVSSASAVICGTHGAIAHENVPFLTCDSHKKVYLSPYEEIDEHTVFGDAKFVCIQKEKDGFAFLRLVF
jgi:hypothetical protein